ncbi:MAG TPA: DUF3105 domain-containing protein [Candidatus Eremiobacteraceae bacterium]|nr:DUF3105 domain-containing protein [Candidatus Eremiobacteraceae bacterium]
MENIRAFRRRFTLVVLVTAALAGCASMRSANSPSASPLAAPQSTPPATTLTPAFVGTHYPTQGHTHLTPGEPDDFVYNSNPPTSGPHREILSAAFQSQTSLPSYVQVHLLEHGNVLLQYNCKCPDVAAALGQIAMQFDKPFMAPGERQPSIAEVQNAEDQGKAVIVAPYPHMQSKVALSAWTHVGTLRSVDKLKIESFINAHLGNPSD